MKKETDQNNISSLTYDVSLQKVNSHILQLYYTEATERSFMFGGDDNAWSFPVSSYCCIPLLLYIMQPLVLSSCMWNTLEHCQFDYIAWNVRWLVNAELERSSLA
jgi:hypothetical protein